MRRKMFTKRLLSMVIAIAMVATLLTACGKNSERGANNSKLVEEQAKQYADVTDVKEITNGVKLTIAVPKNAKAKASPSIKANIIPMYLFI